MYENQVHKTALLSTNPRVWSVASFNRQALQLTPGENPIILIILLSVCFLC